MAVLTQLVDNVVVNTYELSKPLIHIGRHPDCELRIDEMSVSGHHAIVEREQNAYLDGAVDYYITDSASTNGTFVNDLRLNGRQRLNSNDMIRIGWTLFRFVDENENTLEKTAFILEE